MGEFSAPLSLERRFRRMPVEALRHLVSVKDWAEQHGYQPVSVRQMIRTGKLRGYKNGGRWWVDRRYPKLDASTYR